MHRFFSFFFKIILHFCDENLHVGFDLYDIIEKYNAFEGE